MNLKYTHNEVKCIQQTLVNLKTDTKLTHGILHPLVKVVTQLTPWTRTTSAEEPPVMDIKLMIFIC